MMVSLSSGDEGIASVDDLGNIYFKMKGKTNIVASVGEVENSVEVDILENPVSSIQLTSSGNEARTGDVINFKAMCLDKKGDEITDVPVLFTLAGNNPVKGSGASAMISQKGKFVAEQPGIYTILASTGNASSILTLKIVSRDVAREIELVSTGSVQDKATSDLWVWEGVDGKDYAVTGTHSADGKAYFVGCHKPW